MYKVKEVDGIEIFVDEDGKFCAEVAGHKVRRASIASVEKAILQTRSAVTVQMIRGGESYCRSRTEIGVVGFTDGGKARTKDGKFEDWFNQRFLICTPGQVEGLDRLIEEQRDLDDRWREAIGECIEVTRYNFDKIRKEVGSDNQSDL